MYIPAKFAETDRARIADLIRSYPFATLISHNGEAPFASHLPVLYHSDRGDHGTLVTHLARANPQWRQFADGREVLLTFHGPHAYVSPSWYGTSPAVPTWNFAVVHAYGIPHFIDEPVALRAMLRELVARFEAGRPEPYGDALTDAYLDQMMPGIVGLEIPISRLEAKLKLSQNRPATDQARVIAELAASPDQTERETAAWMRRVAQG